jgi:acetolactate synthase-1/3 small subunit
VPSTLVFDFSFAFEFVAARALVWRFRPDNLIEVIMQTLVAYVENKPGVLNRVSSLARRLAINIDSLTVGPTDNDQIARMTIVAHTDAKGGHRLEASLEKLVDVLLAENITDRSLLERDLALIKVKADLNNRPHLMELIKVFRGRVVDVAPDSLIIEVSGTVDKIDGLIEVLRPFGVLEMARSGRISMTRGGDLLQPPEQNAA